MSTADLALEMAVPRMDWARRRRRNLIILAGALLAAVLYSQSAPSSGRGTRLSADGQGATRTPTPSSIPREYEVQDVPIEQPEQQPSCFEKFPWIEDTLEIFYGPARQAWEVSQQTTPESLAAMDEITWMDGYHPGHDVITLRYDSSLGRYNWSVATPAPANQPHKPRCILIPLAQAIIDHGAALAKQFDRKEFKFVIVTEDFAINWRGSTSKLPAFTLCTDYEHSDIPVPDFTYGCYPEAHYTNSSWPAVADLLSTKAAMVPWEERADAIFHRSNWDVGPRRNLMPLLKAVADNGSDVELFGARLDVADSGFTTANRENFVYLDEQCHHKVAIHTAGFSYSAGLKYKLACAQLVLLFDSKYREFYEPALEDGVHVVRLPMGEEGPDDLDEFWRETVPRIRQAVEEATAEGRDGPTRVAAAGQRWALENLTPEALSCYWYGALQRYGELYFGEGQAAKEARLERETEAAAAAPRGGGKEARTKASKGKEGVKKVSGGGKSRGSDA